MRSAWAAPGPSSPRAHATDRQGRMRVIVRPLLLSSRAAHGRSLPAKEVRHPRRLSESPDFALVPHVAGCHAINSSDGHRGRSLLGGEFGHLQLLHPSRSEASPDASQLEGTLVEPRSRSIPKDRTPDPGLEPPLRAILGSGRTPEQLNTDRWELPPGRSSCFWLLFVPSPGELSSG